MSFGVSMVIGFVVGVCFTLLIEELMGNHD